MEKAPIHRCEDYRWNRADGWRSCGRAAHYALVSRSDGYVRAARRAGGLYCRQHAVLRMAQQNESRRFRLRWEHGELLHREVVVGCPECGPI